MKNAPPTSALVEAIFEDQTERLNRLKISHQQIQFVVGPLENQPGGESRVFRVHTQDGDRVLRIDFAQVIRDRAVAILLQNFLSPYAIVPQIYGILEGDELADLLASHSVFADLRSPWAEDPHAPAYSAILMEVVEEGWNLLQPERSTQAPPSLLKWDQNKILRDVKIIGELLTRLDIQVVDPQFLISDRGEVRLIDLDHWYFVDSEDEYYAYDGRAAIRLREWGPRHRIQNDFTVVVEQALKSLLGN